VNGPFAVKKCGACFFHEDATGIRKVHDPALSRTKSRIWYWSSSSVICLQRAGWVMRQDVSGI
jgi:hypothetical protein